VSSGGNTNHRTASAANASISVLRQLQQTYEYHMYQTTRRTDTTVSRRFRSTVTQFWVSCGPIWYIGVPYGVMGPMWYYGVGYVT
jgi:hypothetical protein